MSLTISPKRIVEESDSPLLAAPASWQRRPLGEVATILNGYAFKSKSFTSDGGKPLIRIRDIFNDSTAVGYTGEYDDRYLVRADELLVGMDGDFNCARWRGPEGLLNQRVCKVTPDPALLHLDYLTHILPGYLRAIHDATSSTTVTHLSSRDVAQIPIPVPSITTQQELASLLNSVASKQDSSGSHARRARHSIERLRQALLAAACTGRLTADWRASHQLTSTEPSPASQHRRQSSRGETVDLDLPELPDGYSIGTVGDVSLLIEYGTSERADAPLESGIPILRMGNIQDGRLDLTDLKYRAIDAELKRLVLHDGDLLFNRTNSPELVGKSAVFHGSETMSFASYLIRVRFAPELADPDFVNYWINSAWGRAWARLVKTDGVSQSNINGTKLALMQVPLPPIAEQHEIVKRTSRMLKATEELLRRVDAATRHVGNASHAILAKALRGELVSSGDPGVQNR